jgi:hypothetical protein
MASWREIDRVRKDPAAVRTTAKALLAFRRRDVDFTDWEVDFLQSMVCREGVDELTTRQSEKLLQIRDDAELLTEYRGFSVQLLIKGVHEARSDLSEEDEEWIVSIADNAPTSIRRRHIGRLMRCARQLNLIDDETD